MFRVLLAAPPNPNVMYLKFDVLVLLLEHHSSRHCPIKVGNRPSCFPRRGAVGQTRWCSCFVSSLGWRGIIYLHDPFIFPVKNI
jgi:hypothetical protein